MTVKTYKAIDMQEALRMIKRDLGPQAVILSTRKVVEGRRAFGLLGRPMVEVTAALDAPSQPQAVEPRGSIEVEKQSEGGSKALETLRGEIQELRREMTQMLQASRGPAAELRIRLETELEELRWWASRMARQQGSGQKGTNSSHGGAALFHLVRHGVRERHALQIVRRAEEAEGVAEEDQESFFGRIGLMIQRLSRVQDPLASPIGGGPTILALVGPTGVGKTTTVAKIAARCALEHGRKVALLTNDTYRIAAVEQLRTYARIMGVPLEVVMDPAELPKVLENYMDKDTILIDTAGRSPMDSAQMDELGALLRADERIQPLLLVSATTEPLSLERAVRRFAPLRLAGLIGTKLDEASHFGALFSVSLQMRLPFTFFTTGQRVPEDIRAASREEIASWTLWGLPLFYPEVETVSATG